MREVEVRSSPQPHFWTWEVAVQSIRRSLENVRSGVIRTLARGLYDYPIQDLQLGNLAPRAQEVARALAGRDAVRLQPTGANAANVLGLSTQVPVRVVYLTDGASRKVQIGRLEVILKKTTPRQMATAGRISGTVIQALRWLGKDGVNDSTLKLLRQRLSTDDKSRILEDARFAPAWIAKVMKQIATTTQT